MKKIILTAALILPLSSCNTMVGVGQDFRRFGEGVENKARGKTWTGQAHQQHKPGNTYAPPATNYVPQ